jgi:hypothetical protein
MKHVWIIVVQFAIAVIAGSLTRTKRDAKEDRNFEHQAVGMNGQLRGETRHLQRMDAGVVTAVATLFAATATVLAAIGDYSTKIAVGIMNDGPHKWTGLNVYFVSGTSDHVIPHNVPKGEGFNFPARKTNGPVATGAIGVISLYSEKDDKTINVLYCVPWDTHLFKNWWNVQVHDGKKYADESIYDELYKVAMPGDAKRHRFNVGEGYSCDGVMGDSTQGMLKVIISKKVYGSAAAVIASSQISSKKLGITAQKFRWRS